MGTQMEEVLELVRESLTSTTASSKERDAMEQQIASATDENFAHDEGWDDAEADPDDVVYDDTGAGAGVEGDLEADDD